MCDAMHNVMRDAMRNAMRDLMCNVMRDAMRNVMRDAMRNVMRYAMRNNDEKTHVSHICVLVIKVIIFNIVNRIKTNRARRRAIFKTK